MYEMDRSEAVAAMDAQYDVLDDIITPLHGDELLRPSGCRGWSNADLIYHMLLDAQRALVTFNSPVRGPADKDFVSYWRGFDSSDEHARAHARFVRISASAHHDPQVISQRWHETAPAAVRAARAASGIQFVTTQGHVLATADFIATLVVEAVVHHLDLVRDLDGPGPAPPALSVTTTTLDGLLEAPRPAHWKGTDYILKATGRRALDAEERSDLGDLVGRLPLFS